MTAICLSITHIFVHPQLRWTTSSPLSQAALPCRSVCSCSTMAVDRSAEWLSAVDSACSSLQLSQEDTIGIKGSLLLKRARKPTPFAQAAERVHAAIAELRAFIDEHKRDYVSSGRFNASDKDRIEEEVGLVVKTCTAQIEQLKHSVVAAQEPRGDGAMQINPQTAAHLHGVVLVLVESLHVVSATFDKCRAVRYQQALEKELRQQHKTSHATAEKLSSSWQEEHRQSNGSTTNGNSSQVALQQQTFDDLETRRLMEDLTSTSQQAHQVEKTMREITTLNQMISTAVMQQAESIEQLYSVAVEATGNIKRGNEQLQKTVRLNKSSQLYMFVLLMTATLLLLFFDWFYS